MRNSVNATQFHSFALALIALFASCAHAADSAARYETKRIHDPDGTGKFYMGREIAQVMGPGGLPWLERPEREDEERPSVVLDALNLKGGETVVDFGAGSGYYTFRLAKLVGPRGAVLAVDIEPKMLE